MDELKEIYGIEMTTLEKKAVAVSILTNEWVKTVDTLAKSSNRTRRVDALMSQEEIKWIMSLIGERK